MRKVLLLLSLRFSFKSIMQYDSHGRSGRRIIHYLTLLDGRWDPQAARALMTILKVLHDPWCSGVPVEMDVTS